MSTVLEEKYMTVSEVAAELGISRQRVHALIIEGQISAHTVHEKLRMVDTAEFERFKSLPRPTGIHVDKRPQPRKRRTSKRLT